MNNIHHLPKQFFQPLIAKAIELLDVEKIILFGSYARGDFHPKSDIDLAFIFSQNTKYYQNWLVFKDWVNREFLTLKSVDLVILSSVSTEFQTSILEEGIILYER